MSTEIIRQQVVRFCKAKKLALCLPSKASRGILVTDYSTGFGRHIAEGVKWVDIERQLIDWQHKEYGL